MINGAALFIRQIGQIVREKRSGEGLTQRQFAEKAGVSERLVRSIEKGDSVGVQLDKLVAVLSALGLRLSVVGAEDQTAMRQPSDFIDAEYEELFDRQISVWYSREGDPHE